MKFDGFTTVCTEVMSEKECFNAGILDITIYILNLVVFIRYSFFIPTRTVIINILHFTMY